MRGAIEWGERHQIAIYLAAIAVGAGVGLLIPGAAAPLEATVMPVLGALLYATFLGVPLGGVRRALRDRRFLGAVLLTNFVVIPLVVFGLSRFVAHDQALLLGVLLVLLTPCVDYVIVFSGLAGGARDRLLAATPLLMLVQVLLLPMYLRLMAGPGVVDAIDPGPFVDAFLWLIVVPLALAAVTQYAASRWRAGRLVRAGALSAMVPLMTATLAVVVASQVPGVRAALGSLLAVLLLFAAFPLLAAPLGALAGRVARLDRPARISLAFSVTTRNSLVVLPLALALPPAFALTPIVVVTQTLVELLAMVVMVALVRRAGKRTRIRF